MPLGCNTGLWNYCLSVPGILSILNAVQSPTFLLFWEIENCWTFKIVISKNCSDPLEISWNLSKTNNRPHLLSFIDVLVVFCQSVPLKMNFSWQKCPSKKAKFAISTYYLWWTCLKNVPDFDHHCNCISCKLQLLSSKRLY